MLVTSHDDTSRKQLHNNYCRFMKYDTFQCIVIDNTNISSDIRDRVNLFRADN